METAMNSLSVSWTFVVASIAALIAAFALGFTFKGDRRKTGTDIRYTVGMSLDLISPEPWVRRISLRNGKDRSIAIYGIYLEIGHGFFVEIEDLTATPVVLAPYGAWYREYDPVDAYVGDLRRWTEVFDQTPRRQTIMLLTSEGRHYPKLPKDTFDPRVYAVLKNRATVTVIPQRFTVHGRYYGTKARYLCAITDVNGQRHEFPVYADSTVNQVKNGLQMTDDNLQTADGLRMFLEGELQAGRLATHVGNVVEVVDLAPGLEEMNQRYFNTVPFKPLGWFEYRILYRLITMLSRRKRYKLLHDLIMMVWNWRNRRRAEDDLPPFRPGPQGITIRAEGSDTEIQMTAVQLERRQGPD